jgi:hypothetical protein
LQQEAVELRVAPALPDLVDRPVLGRAHVPDPPASLLYARKKVRNLAGKFFAGMGMEFQSFLASLPSAVPQLAEHPLDHALRLPRPPGTIVECGVFGGGSISRIAAGNSAFQGQYINATSYNTAFGASSPASIGFTRATMATLLAQVTDRAGGEAPTFVVMSPGDYARLNTDFIGNEQQFVNK